jgi:hypothetical protein
MIICRPYKTCRSKQLRCSRLLGVTMRRAKLKGFAPHIPVLYREVPFILNISGAACSYSQNGTEKGRP